MRPEADLIIKSQLRKKQKRRSRYIRLVIILIFFLIIISIIFITLNNPDFLKEIKSKFESFYSSGSNIGAGVQESSIESEENNQSTGNSQSFFQKIAGIFRQRFEKQSEDFPENLKIRFYFASLGKEEKFVFEERNINAGSPEIAAENIMRELLRGPSKSFNYPVIPPATELKDVEIYENLVKINLSQEFLENSLESGILDEYVIYTIVNTVTQIPGIEGVIFLIDGKRIKLYGNVDLSIPAIPDEQYLPSEE